MGKSGSGKTSMRSIIFSNYVAKDTRRLGATIDVEHSNVKFLSNLVLNLWDCGGQEVFMENFLNKQKEHIFQHVQVLIYVFDVESAQFENELEYFAACYEAVKTYSNDCKVVCLIHKMDLVQEDKREEVFELKMEAISTAVDNPKIDSFKTSIWDESLYKAWSNIVYSLIPNIEKLESHLQKFCKLNEASEIVLFEKSTLLVVAHSSKNLNDQQRFEKISNIIKQLKLSCYKYQSQFTKIEIRHDQFAAFIDSLTTNTFMLVAVSGPGSKSAVPMINIKAVRKHFENIETQTE